MTDDVRREVFDSRARQYGNEVFTADSERETGKRVRGGTARAWGRRPAEQEERESVVALGRSPA